MLEIMLRLDCCAKMLKLTSVLCSCLLAVASTQVANRLLVSAELHSWLKVDFQYSRAVDLCKARHTSKIKQLK